MFLYSIINYFNESNIKNSELINAGIMFFFFFLIIGTTAKFTVKSRKTLAWVVSVVNSFLMASVGNYYLCKTLYKYPQLLTAGPNGHLVYEQSDNLAKLCCIFFLVANLFDLVYGFLFYREQLSILTTYIHHSMFMWSSFAFCTGNAIFFSVTPTPGGFTIAMIEEVPTFLLALGSIFPQYRTDLGFGVSFFLLRICFHGYYWAYAIYSRIHIYPILIITASMCLHVMWFSQWVSKYGKKLLAPKKKE